ncbi:MAG: hypothetical protein RLY20_181 [Verrucomicrobiota bacterium]|jgi:alpha-tubulin suppressor-like RCC1 family protein
MLGWAVIAASRTSAATPYAATQPAFPVKSTSATLNGMAVANGEPTFAWFEWGTNFSFGQTTAPLDVGSDFAVLRTNTPISGLNPGEVYAFRLVVSNASGVAWGAPQMLTTGKKIAAWGDNTYNQSAAPLGLTQIVAVACGSYHSLALDVTGKVAAWGYNVYNQTNVPATLSNVVAIAGGIYHSLALRDDGTITGWGRNFSSEATPPASATNVIAIAAGDYFSLALRTDGTPIAWGDGFFGQTNIPFGLANVVAIACGDAHCLALLADGTVQAWGDNIFGQTTVPAGLNNVIGIAGGNGFSVAVKADGSVVEWGWPYTSPGSIGAIAAGAGWAHFLALNTNRVVTYWGSDTAASVPPPGLINVSALTAQWRHNLAIADNTPPVADPLTFVGPHNQDLTVTISALDPNGDALNYQITGLPTNGVLYQYSGGARGAAIVATNTPVTDPLGRVIYAPPAHAFGSPYTSFNFLANDGSTNSSVATLTIFLVPTKSFTDRPTDIASNTATLNGTVLPNGEPTSAWFEWGANGTFNNSTALTSLGSSNLISRFKAAISGLTPGVIYQSRLMVSNASVGVMPAATQRFTTGLRLAGWGSGTSGQTNFPAATTNIVALAAGGSHNVALRAGGTILSWGLNTSGQTNVPANLTNTVAVAAGSAHSLALLSDGRVRAWGRNTSGQTNVPASVTNIVAIAAGANHCLAVRNDGRVIAWGDNAAGQTNIPVNTTNVVALAAGVSNSFALRVDGVVVAWGGSGGNLLSVPSAATNVIAIAAGNFHALALRSNGTVVTWGTNNFGQTNLPAGLSNVVAIAAGANHSLAIKSDGSTVAWGGGSLGQTNVPATLTALAAAGGDSHSVALGNVVPTANALTSSGYVSHDVVLTLTGADLNKDALGFRLLSLPLSGTLYQYNAGSRGAAISGGNPNVTDAAGRIIFAPGSGLLGANFASFVANDGLADSPPALLTVNVGLPATPSFTSGSIDTNGAFSAIFTGSSNATYSVWASTNLSSWEFLGSATPTTGTSYQWLDASATNWMQRFYRATAP